MNFKFEPLQNSHLNLVYQWLNLPHISERWDGALSIDEVRHKYFTPDKITNIERYIAYQHGSPIGYVQNYWATRCGDGWWEDVKDPDTIGIDFFIGSTEHLNQGVGTEMIREFVQMLLRNPTVTKIVCDPAPNNPQSIRCLEKVGFRKIKEIQTPDGTALLMEMSKIF